jgi:hypothetical protein
LQSLLVLFVARLPAAKQSQDPLPPESELTAQLEAACQVIVGVAFVICLPADAAFFNLHLSQALESGSEEEIMTSALTAKQMKLGERESLVLSAISLCVC